MVRFIKNLLLFSIPLLAVSIYFYHITNQLYYQPYSPKPAYGKFDTFILADSHGAALAENPEKFGIFNFSQPSDNYEDLYRKLLFLTRHVKVRAIILTADDHTLSPHREEINNGERSIQLLTAREAVSDPQVELLFHYFITRYAVLLNNRTRNFVHLYFTKILHLAPQSLEVTEDAWENNTNQEQISRSLANVQLGYPNSSLKLKNVLKDILTLCREKNIAVTAVKFPLSNSYSRAIGKTNFGADSLLRAFGVPMLDYKNIFAASDSLFADPDHLNAAGGKLFTERFLSSTLISNIPLPNKRR